MEIPFSPERLAQGRRAFSQMADEAGLEYGDRTRWYDSGPAHEATCWASDRRAGDAFKRAVFRAYFAEGRNIASTEVLTMLANNIGLDSSDLQRALADGTYRDRVQSQYEEARQIGVTAVPTFVADGYALVGAHPYESFRRLMAQVGAVPRTPANESEDRFQSADNLLDPTRRTTPRGDVSIGDNHSQPAR